LIQNTISLQYLGVTWKKFQMETNICSSYKTFWQERWCCCSKCYRERLQRNILWVTLRTGNLEVSEKQGFGLRRRKLDWYW